MSYKEDYVNLDDYQASMPSHCPCCTVNVGSLSPAPAGSLPAAGPGPAEDPWGGEAGNGEI